jgi:hypothetical protein
MQIRIQETKPMLIQADPNLDQIFESQKVEFSHEKYRYLLKVGNRYKRLLANSMLLDQDPHSQYGSGSNSQMNADPGGSGSTTLVIS